MLTQLSHTKTLPRQIFFHDSPHFACSQLQTNTVNSNKEGHPQKTRMQQGCDYRSQLFVHLLLVFSHFCKGCPCVLFLCFTPGIWYLNSVRLWQVEKPVDTWTQHAENISRSFSSQCCLVCAEEEWANAEVTEAHLPPSCLFLFPIAVSLPLGVQQWGIRCLGALCYLGSVCCCWCGFRDVAAPASAARPVFPCRQLWARQCMVITTRAQSASMQEPSKQNRQTVEGICCALDMVWMQAVFSFSHSSDSWDFFWRGWKGESRLHSCSLCPSACTWLYRVMGKWVTAGMHLCACIFWKNSDTASHIDRWGSQQSCGPLSIQTTTAEGTSTPALPKYASLSLLFHFSNSVGVLALAQLYSCYSNLLYD